MKTLELAQLNVFTPAVKKSRAGHWQLIPMCLQTKRLGGMECVWRTWEWSLTWSEITGMGGFDMSAANRGVYAGLVHGIASRFKPKPKVSATPATGGPPPPHPPNTRDAVAKALGAISPALDKQGKVC